MPPSSLLRVAKQEDRICQVKVSQNGMWLLLVINHCRGVASLESVPGNIQDGVGESLEGMPGKHPIHTLRLFGPVFLNPVVRDQSEATSYLPVKLISSDVYLTACWHLKDEH